MRLDLQLYLFIGSISHQGSTIYIRGLCTPYMPIVERIIVPKAGTLSYLMVFFKFNFLALVVSEILGVPKFTLGPCAPRTRPSEKL